MEPLGVEFVKDLFKKTGNSYIFKTDEELLRCVQGNRVKQLKLYGIISAIPKKWIKILKGELDSNLQKIGYDYQSIPRKITTIVYNQLTHKEKSHQELAMKWSNKIGAGLSAEELDVAFQNICKIVSSVKLRDFQYRFLHRKIFTNYILKKWKIVESDRCDFCETGEYETLEHLFFNCPITKRFWTLLSCWYEAMMDTEINLTYKSIVINQYSEDKISILDTIILMAKQYIFRCKCLSRLPNFYNFKEEMFQVCRMERRIAFHKHKEKAFRKKWGLFLK